MQRLAFAFALALLPSTAFLACSDDSSDGSGTNGSGASSASSTGPGPGSGGAGNEGGAGASGATGGMGTGGEPTGGTGGGVAGDHLLISELAAAPNAAEFVEIHNPTAAAIDLSDYYLSDNSTYHEFAAGDPFAPITDNPGSDFLAQFPPGTMIPAGGFIVIATSEDFEMTYGACPSFILSDTAVTCAQGMAAAMEIIPTATNDELVPGTLFSNSREMVILFKWDGNNASPVEDVDYLTWGSEFEPGTRVDKTGVGAYQPDTAPGMQKGAPVPEPTQSIERCPANTESGETTSGGNGISGHDETSEALDMSFKLQTAPTPGEANGCN